MIFVIFLQNFHSWLVSARTNHALRFIKNILIYVWMISNMKTNMAPFKIQYYFNDDSKLYPCLFIFEQYQNFKKLPAVAECRIVPTKEKHVKLPREIMQKALGCKK